MPSPRRWPRCASSSFGNPLRQQAGQCKPRTPHGAHGTVRPKPCERSLCGSANAPEATGVAKLNTPSRHQVKSAALLVEGAPLGAPAPPPAGVRGVGFAVIRGHPCPHLPCRSRGAPVIWMRTQAWLGLGEACNGVVRPGPSPPWDRRCPRRQGSEGWRWFPPMKVARMPEDQGASPHPDQVRTGSRRRHQTRLPVVPDPEREGRDAVPAWCARLMRYRRPAVVAGRWGWED